MLTESLVAAVQSAEKATDAVIKDIGIHIYDFQPIPAPKTVLKKSSAPTNCLAVSTSHIFTAQVQKAVVHVYSREQGNQEATVPFPERIHSLALAGDSDGAGILLLGTEGGRVILWELCTGRQVSTSQSHLQSTTCLAVDPTSNFFLSGSSDSNIHLWSIPALLSFSAQSPNDYSQQLPLSPLETLSNHRAAISALVFGHSSSSTNIAVSASQDNTCIVWDYTNGAALHTFLLPTSPLCLALDPADRAVYAGYEDGSIQLIDFYKQSSLTQALHDPTLQSTPTQPPPSDRWPLPIQSSSSALCLQLSYDGTTLLSGHQDGKVQAWDVAKGKYTSHIADFSAPVTNLYMLSPTGFPIQSRPHLKTPSIVKPRYESSLDGGNTTTSTVVPPNYTFTAQFNSNLPLPRFSTLSSSTIQPPTTFQAALTHPSFPPTLLQEGLASLTNTSLPLLPKTPITTTIPSTSTSQTTTTSSSPTPETTNALLTTQLANSQTQLQKALAELLRYKKETWQQMEREEVKAKAKKKRRLRRMRAEEARRKRVMGEEVGMEVDVEEDGEEEVSSSTDEMTPSD